MNIISFLIFDLGLLFGFLIIFLLGRRRSCIGTIMVIKKKDGILYSLEMNDSPENLQFKKRACFKVKVSEEES